MIDWGGWRLYIALFMGAFCLHLTHWAVVTELPSVFWLGRSVALIHLMLAGAEIQTWQIYEDELKMFVILEKWVPFIVICIVIHMLWHYRILYRDISSKKYVISYSYLCLSIFFLFCKTKNIFDAFFCCFCQWGPFGFDDIGVLPYLIWDLYSLVDQWFDLIWFEYPLKIKYYHHTK